MFFFMGKSKVNKKTHSKMESSKEAYKISKKLWEINLHKYNALPKIICTTYTVTELYSYN